MPWRSRISPSTGERLELAGNLRLGRDGSLREAAFTTVRLDGDTDVAISLRAAGDGLSASVTGQSFDARPLIDQLFSTSSSPADGDALTMRIEADVQRLLAHRGEAITEVRGTMQLTGGVVDAADLAGRFSNGGPVSLRVVAAGSDLRQLRLTGGDGGAALRAVDLYSKIRGGAIDFSAWLGPGRTGSVQRGLLVIDRFDVEDEVVLNEVDLPTGRGTASAPRQRREGSASPSSSCRFPSTTPISGSAMPWSGPRDGRLGARPHPQGRRALDIGGTIIPAYALNAALSDMPLLGDPDRRQGRGHVRRDLCAERFAPRPGSSVQSGVGHRAGDLPAAVRLRRRRGGRRRHQGQAPRGDRRRSSTGRVHSATRTRAWRLRPQRGACGPQLDDAFALASASVTMRRGSSTLAHR
jgi:hypothetical protein